MPLPEAQGDRPNYSKARIDIIANHKEYECGSCDSRIDFGSGGTLMTLTRAALMWKSFTMMASGISKSWDTYRFYDITTRPLIAC